MNHIGGSIATDARSMEFSDDTFENNGVNYDSLYNGKAVHTGGDSKNSIIGTSINAAFGGRIDPSNNPLLFSTLFSITGSSVTIESGFNFGNRFISTGVWVQYRHMNNMTNVFRTVIEQNKKLGELSNVWASGKIDAHLHLDIVTQTNSNTAQWFRNLFNSEPNSNITWKVKNDDTWTDGANSYNRTYWKPKQIWDEYWKVVK